MLVLLTALALIAPPPLPRFGVLSDPALLASFLATVAGTLAAIVGILIAILLVALELLRATYASYALREVFRVPALRHLLTIYIFTVGLALLALASVAGTVSQQLVSLTYLVGVLAACCLVVLYPATRAILVSARADRKRIRELSAALTVEELGRIADAGHYPLPYRLAAIEGHPLFLLGEIASRSIADGDRITPRVVTVEVARSVVGVLDRPGQDAYQLRQLINPFLLVFRSISDAALRHRDELTLAAVFGVSEDIQEAAAKARVPWHALIEFNEYLRDTMRLVAACGLETASAAAFRCAQRSQEAHLRHNVPAEADVWMFHIEDLKQGTKPDHEKGLQWEKIGRGYVDMIVGASEAATLKGHSGVVSSGLMALWQTVDTVERLENLGPQQRADIIQSCYYHTEALVVQTAEKTGSPLTSALLAFGALASTEALHDDKPWAKAGLMRFCSTLRRLAELKRLERFSLNELGTIGRGCVEHIRENRRFPEALLLITDTLTQIAACYDPPRLAEEVYVVKEIDRQLESLERWFAAKGTSHHLVQERIDRARSTVRDIQVLGRYLGTDRLEWPRLPEEDARQGERADDHV